MPIMTALDTHQAFISLTKAGATSDLAEALISTVRESLTENLATKADMEALGHRMETFEHRMDGMDQRMDGLATKADFEALGHRIDGLGHRIDGLEQTTKADNQLLRSELKLAISQSQNRMTLRLGAMMVAGFGLIGVLDKFW